MADVSIADGKCIYDFAQSSPTSSPSHVEFLNDYEAPFRALQAKCVEEGEPPCMFVPCSGLYALGFRSCDLDGWAVSRVF